MGAMKKLSSPPKKHDLLTVYGMKIVDVQHYEKENIVQKYTSLHLRPPVQMSCHLTETKAKYVRFLEIYWQKMEQKIHINVFSLLNLNKSKKYWVFIC